MFSASFLRALTLATALLAPALALSGCGGGGSGGGGTGPSVPPPTGGGTTGNTTGNSTGGTTGGTTAGSTTGGATGGGTTGGDPTPPSNGNRQLFFDDFTTPTLSTSLWDNLDQYQPLQRTYFGNRPINLNQGGTTFTRLTLDSYNPTPNYRGQFFRGTEILSRSFFTVGDGLEAEARLRGPDLPAGIVFAFFLINDRPEPEGQRKDEIDFEFVTAQQEQFGGRNRLYTNVWNNWNEGRDGFDGNPLQEDTPNRMRDDLVYQPSANPNYDYADWNTYRIRWYPNRTEFYVNGRLERTENEVKPDKPLQLRFNIWTPIPEFAQAFSGNLPGPVPSPSSPDRRIYDFDVDYVRVTALSAGASQARVASPTEVGAAQATMGRLQRSR